MSDHRCLECKQEMTWAQQRSQFKRAIRAGLTPDETKAIMPRCQKCTTEVLQARNLSPGHRGRYATPYGAAR